MNEELLSVITKAGDPPGLSLVVVKNERIVFSKGFGLADGPRNIPATQDTVYHWWSMTKVPTAIAILQLQEREMLDIDDPVSQYLPLLRRETSDRRRGGRDHQAPDEPQLEPSRRKPTQA